MDATSAATETEEEQSYPEFIDVHGLGEVTGTIEGFSEALTKFGQPTVVVTLRTEEGLGSLWLSPIVLKSQFARLRPKVGERIHVVYLGMREGAGGSYHNYRVDAPDRPPFQPDWETLGTSENWGEPTDAAN